MKKKVEIMNHVDIAELVKVHVYRPNVYKPGILNVSLEPLEEGKRVIIDEDAKKTLDRVLTEKCQEFEDARDPKVAKYIEEFVSRMIIEWHRNGLMIIEDIPDAPDDPYAAARNKFKHLN